VSFDFSDDQLAIRDAVEPDYGKERNLFGRLNGQNHAIQHP
jgi:hypothetical protein